MQIIRWEKLRRFCDVLIKTEKPLAAFDSRLWCAVAENVTVYSMNRVAVRFTSGMEVEADDDG